MAPTIVPLERPQLAHFQVCKCGSHGRIVFPDGRTGGEIISKEDAEVVLQYVGLVHKFQSVDIFPGTGLSNLYDEINASTLPEKTEVHTEHMQKVFKT